MKREKALQFLKLAIYQAELFSKDPSTKVGCIMIAPDSLQILSCGYNGLPRNINEKQKERWQYPLKSYYCEHSERNCLYNACRSGVKLEGCIAIVSLFPCAECARGLIQSGVSTIVTFEPDYTHHRWGQSFKISSDMLKEANVELILTTPGELQSITST